MMESAVHGTGLAQSVTDSMVLIVEDPQRSQRPGVKAMRRALIRALARLDVGFRLVDELYLEQDIQISTFARDLLVIAEGGRSLALARRRLERQSRVRFAQIVVPTSYAVWGPYSSHWASDVSADPHGALTFLTDSDLSRGVIEEHLRRVRADVRVIQPAWDDVAEAESRGDKTEHLDFRSAKESRGDVSTTSWSFGASKTSPRHRELTSTGLTWSFGDPLGEPSRLGPSLAERETGPDAINFNSNVVNGLLHRPRRAEGSLRVAVLGTKLAFIDELARDLTHASNAEVTLDEWTHLAAPVDQHRSQALIDRSDVIVGEWARPNNVWIQQHAANDKRLIVRAHRYEVTVDFPASIDMSRFESSVAIVPWVGRVLVQKFGWPAEKMVYIPNYINTRYFRRPKLPGSEYTLGMVGVTPDLKRLDLALDLLEALREHDTRYTLRIRGSLPPEHINWARQPSIPQQWGSIQHRLRTRTTLRNSVFFDTPGRDMANWFQGVGVILSLSDLEGSHVALAEGVASGALPVARPWPGITTMWPTDLVMDDLPSAVDWLLQAQDHTWRQDMIERLQAHPMLDQDRVLDAWWSLINGRRNEAQAAFGPVDWTVPPYTPIESPSV